MIPVDIALPFIVTVCGFMLIPGPAMLYVATVGVQRGKNAGITAATGMASGSFLLATAAAVGLTAAMAASETLFTVFKVCGVVYLVYLGIRRLSTPMTDLNLPVRDAGPSASTNERSSELGLFHELGRGILVSLSNPKDALFFFAFLPQFTSSVQSNVQLQMFLLGAVFSLIALVFDSCYGVLAAGLRRLLIKRPKLWRSQRWISGSAYLLMAAVAAVSNNRVRA